MESVQQSSRLQQAFHLIEDAANVSEALEIVQRLYRLDFVTYHLAHSVTDMVDAPFVRTTYGETWVAHYLLSGYVKRDPVVHQGFLRQMPFDWREIVIPDTAMEFLAQAAKHGLGANGFSIPVVDKLRRALFSINSKQADEQWNVTVAECRGEWIEIANQVHRKAILEAYEERDPVPLLGQREIQCLYWAALGNDAKGIALILGLSEHTTRSYLKSARLKLGCLTTTAATVRANHLRIINPYGNTPI